MGLLLLLVSWLTFVELNCENLFDCKHDSLKNDAEFTPDGLRHWTPYRYWRKLNQIAREIISCGEGIDGGVIPDIVALCEVENDSVMYDLTRRSSLKALRYDYLMPPTSDNRGIGVALLYHRFSFAPLKYYSLSVQMPKGFRQTRDILYVSGRVMSGDTLHLFVVHAPSRYGGEHHSRPARMAVARRLVKALDSLNAICSSPHVIMMGDFNDVSKSASLAFLLSHGMANVSDGVKGRHGAGGTYRYQGKWETIDHFFVSAPIAAKPYEIWINDSPFLTVEDKKYGGRKPHRTFIGYRYQHDGFSDHLPLVFRYSFR